MCQVYKGHIRMLKQQPMKTAGSEKGSKKPGEVFMKVFDRNAMLKRIMGDEDLLKELVKSFFHSTQKDINALKEALEKGDAAEAGNHAHSIKGAAGNFSALPLQDVALRIEKAAKGGDTTEAVSLMPELLGQFDKLKEIEF